jgi:hypothetical protein
MSKTGQNTARTDRNNQRGGESPAKWLIYQAVDPQAVFVMAGDNSPLRVDHPQ